MAKLRSFIEIDNGVRGNYTYFRSMKSSLRDKKIAVLGGNGFFGSHIVDLLKAQKLQVYISSTKEGVDFRKFKDCRYYFKKTSPDIVINCAAIQGGIGYHEGKQADLLGDNMMMGFNLMLAAFQENVKKFVNIVAGCTYPGYLEKQVMHEEDFWDGEVHDSIFSYGVARKASVAYGKALHKQYGFNSIHLILANMYGPRDHYDPIQSKALAALIKKIYEAKKNNLPSVEIWGTGKPLRDWLFVKDGAEGVLRATEVYNRIEPLNISTGIGVSVTKLAKLIKDVVGYKGRFEYNTNRPDGALKKVFGTKKMKKELSWQPSTSIEKGIEEAVKWFDRNHDKIRNS